MKIAYTVVAALIVLPIPTHAQKGPGEGPCHAPSECSSNLCMELNGESYCSQICEAVHPGCTATKVYSKCSP